MTQRTSPTGRMKKNHRSTDSQRVKSNGRKRADRVKGQSILPPASVIQEYEYATEGAADKLFEMAANEQKHRQQLEQQYLDDFRKSVRIGQVFGLVALLGFVASLTALSVMGFSFVAVLMAGGAFITITLSNIFLALSNRKKRVKKKYPTQQERTHYSKDKSTSGSYNRATGSSSNDNRHNEFKASFKRQSQAA